MKIEVQMHEQDDEADNEGESKLVWEKDGDGSK